MRTRRHSANGRGQETNYLSARSLKLQPKALAHFPSCYGTPLPFLPILAIGLVREVRRRIDAPALIGQSFRRVF